MYWECFTNRDFFLFSAYLPLFFFVGSYSVNLITMAKSQYKSHQNNNNNQQGKPYGRNHGNNNHNQNNRKFNNNHGNHYNGQKHQQPKNRIVKPKEVPINHSIKGPLFDKSKLVSSWKFRRPIGPGLINGHNTCFLNSVLECLTYTPPLAQYLLREEHKNNCKVSPFYEKNLIIKVIQYLNES